MLLLLVTACAGREDNIFDESPSLRMQATLDNAREVLMSAPQGWAFDYYPDSRRQYGGFAFTVSFDATHATVGSEVKPGTFCRSLYRLTDDSGPVLTFDSYNEVMHYFATPSSDYPRGKDGDFEFIILNVTTDVITLRGKRTGNTMYMYRLTQSPESYLTSTIDMARDIYLPLIHGTVGATTIDGSVQPEQRIMTLTWGNGEKVSQYFIPTPRGIRFLQPITVAGETIREMSYSHRDMEFKATGSTGKMVSLNYTVGPDYTIYDDFLGDWQLVYDNGAKTLPMTLVANADKTGYLMRGLNPTYDVQVRYERNTGCLNFCSQQVGTDTVGDVTVQVWFTCKDINGKYSVNPECGMFCKRDLDNPGSYKFSPNTYPTVKANSFYVAQIKSRVAIDPIDGDAPAAWHVNGDPVIPRVVALRRQ